MRGRIPPLRSAPTPCADPPDPAALAGLWRGHGLFAPGERVLVAVSGGADSVALAALLAAASRQGLPLTLTLAHLDHGWRGAEEAALDRAVVETLAARLHLPLVTAGPPRPPAPGETAARRWRYGTLARLAHETGAQSVAVAHHLRDQAETVLMRLLRGSGAHGLTGMAPTRPLDAGRLRVVRPLLGIHPDALRAFNRAQGLAWREDPSNQAPGVRNDLRRRLLALEARAQDPCGYLAALAQRLRARLERRDADLRAAILGSAEVLAPEGVVRLSRDVLRAHAATDLGAALRTLGSTIGADAGGTWFGGRHLARIGPLLAAGGALDLPQGLALRVTPRWVWLLRRTAPPLERYHLEVEPVAAERGAEVLALTRRRPFEALLDAERLGPSPRLRRLVPGDRFVPHGRGARGAVDVEAWLMRHGIPRRARRALLAVEGAHGLAWVVGLRIDATHALGVPPRPATHLRITAAVKRPGSDPGSHLETDGV